MYVQLALEKYYSSTHSGVAKHCRILRNYKILNLTCFTTYLLCNTVRCSEHPLRANQCSSAEVLVQGVDESHVPAPLSRRGVRATDHATTPARRTLHSADIFVGVVGSWRRRWRSWGGLKDLDVTRAAIWWGGRVNELQSVV